MILGGVSPKYQAATDAAIANEASIRLPLARRRAGRNEPHERCYQEAGGDEEGDDVERKPIDVRLVPHERALRNLLGLGERHPVVHSSTCVDPSLGQATRRATRLRVRLDGRDPLPSGTGLPVEVPGGGHQQDREEDEVMRTTHPKRRTDQSLVRIVVLVRRGGCSSQTHAAPRSFCDSSQ
jgi:hypothetical protein